MKNKLINFRLITLLSISFFIGIIFIYFIYFYNKYILAVTGFIFYLMIVSVFFILKKEKFKKIIIYFILSTLCFLLAIGCCMAEINTFLKAEITEKEYYVKGKVTEINYVSENDIKLKLINLSFDNNKKPVYYKLYLNVKDATENQIYIGNNVEFYAKVINNDIIYESKPDIQKITEKAFYKSYCSAENIIVKKGNIDLFNKANNFIKSSLKKGLDGNAYKIAVGLVLGETEQIDSNIISNYRYGGVAHIFAVSGLHIGFLAGILIIILKFLKNSYVKSFIISLILIFYAGVCGFKVSSLRATIMAVTLLLTSCSGKKYDLLSSVSFSMILILIFSPFEAFQIGFVLSFSAVYSICLLSPVIKRNLRFLPYKLSSYISVTFSATLGTLPFCVFYFGYFSMASLLLNLIIVPIISFLFSFLILAIIIGGILNICKVTLFIPKIIINFVQIILNNNYKTFICVSEISIILIVLYYIILILFSDIINFNIKIKNIVACLLAIVFCFSFTIWNFDKNKEIKMCVIGENDYQIVFFYGKENNMIIHSSSILSNYSRIFSFMERKNITSINNIIITGETDIQNIATKFLEEVEINKIYYYGEKIDYLYNGINVSFNNINDEEIFSAGKLKLNYLSGGFLIALFVDDVNILIINENNFIEKAEYLKSSKFEMVITKDNFDNYTNIFKTNVIGFVSNEENFLNAEYEKLFFRIRNGNIVKVID